MESSSAVPTLVRFGIFEADLASGELRKRGRRVPLQDQPFQILAILLRRRGELVTREELQQALWPADTFVEFEHGINMAVQRLRQALGDSADNPRFIETLPRKGYRFIAPVEDLTPPGAIPVSTPVPVAAPVPVSAPVPAPAVRMRRRWWLAGAGVLVAVAAGCALWLLNRPGKAIVAVPVPLTSYPGIAASPSFSPEGDRVAFSWNGPKQDKFDIYVKLVGEGQPVRLTNDAVQDYHPAWSPDGRWIAFLREFSSTQGGAFARWNSDARGGVFLIPAVGGTERKITEVREGLWAVLAWHPGGRWLVVSHRNSAQEPFALFLVSVETGEKRKLTSPPGNLYGDFDPAFSPDGRAIVFARFPTSMESELYLLELSADLRPMGEPKRITFLQGCTHEPAWWPDGNSILFSSGGTCNNVALWRMAIRGATRRPGEPERLPFGGESHQHSPVVSRQGRVAYMQNSAQTAHIWRLELGGSHRAVNMPMNSTRVEHCPQYSPDGKRIAFGSNRSGSHEIWVCDADGSNVVKLTSFGGPYVANPAWSPDGRRIAFDVRPNNPMMDSYIVSADGGKPERLPGSRIGDGFCKWSRDGKWIYFYSSRTGKSQVWKVPAGGGDAVQVTKQEALIGCALESPDGRFFYQSRSVHEGDIIDLWQVPAEGGEEIRIADRVAAQFVSVTERGIYFFSGWVNPSAQCFNFATRKVETVGKVEGKMAWGLSVSPDNRYLLYSVFGPDESDLMMVEGYRP